MTFKKTQLNRVLLGLSLTLSIGVGFTALAAMADEIIIPGYTALSGDVVKLVDTNGKLYLGEDGRLYSTAGQVIGVVSSPDVTVVKQVPAVT
ncbi:MAG: hypothetical protein K2Z81_11705 [Cyanobacteria bacterium]|nr:hypothetical protein [Cyanobacteriota bacterium]